MVLDGILYFAENMGQLEGGCKYILEQSAYKVLFYSDAVEFILYGEQKDDHIFLNLNLRDTDGYQEQDELFLAAKDKMNISISYLSGPKGQWVRNVPVYEKLCYYNVCDGINMEFYIQDGCLKQNFVVYSVQSLQDLKLHFSGQKELYAGKDHSIIIVGEENMFEMDTPYNYFYQRLEHIG